MKLNVVAVWVCLNRIRAIYCCTTSGTSKCVCAQTHTHLLYVTQKTIFARTSAFLADKKRESKWLCVVSRWLRVCDVYVYVSGRSNLRKGDDDYAIDDGRHNTEWNCCGQTRQSGAAEAHDWRAPSYVFSRSRTNSYTHAHVYILDCVSYWKRAELRSHAKYFATKFQYLATDCVSCLGG